MKKQILILLGMILFIGIVSAQCRTTYDIRDATEQVTKTIQVPVYDTVTTTVSQPDYSSYQSDMRDYNSKIDAYRTQVNSYLAMQDKMGQQRPQAIQTPKLAFKDVVTTKQVQRTKSKTVYYIDWLNLKISSKTTTVPVYEDKEITTSQLKKGFNFDEDTGEFYRSVKC